MRDMSISVRYARAVLHHAVREGQDPLALLKQNRISHRLLLERQARISLERFADLQVSTMLAMGDEALGYAARRLPPGTWAMMCHAVIGSETLGQALSRYCRYYQLFDADAHPVLDIDDDVATLSLPPTTSGVPRPPYWCELLLFNVHRFGSWLVQEHLPLLAVDLAYPQQADSGDYRQMFRGNPVVFEQRDSGLKLSATVLGKRVVQGEQSLRHFLRHPVLMMLTQDYARNSWTAQVRQIVRRNLVDVPALTAVAGELGIHPQTLRRRLSAEGSTFKDIKNQVRRDTALHFLGKHGLGIEEIAHRAGFSESSAFIRAFKGWTGITPYTYRKGL